MENKKSSQTLIFCMAMVSILSWAANYPATRYVLQYYSPGSIAMLRALIAAAILLTVAFARKTRLPEKKDLPRIVIAGFVGIFMFNVSMNIGASYVVSGVGSFIINSAPVFTLILSRLFLKEIVKPACWIGVMISFCGLVTVMMSQTTGFTLNIGVFILLICALAHSSYNVILRGLLKTYTFLETATYTVTTAAVFFLTLTPLFVRDLPNRPPLSANLVVFLMGIFPAGLAYLTWGYALSKAEKTTHVTVFLYLTPFLATLIGFLWLGEPIYLLSIMGGVVIIGGMVLTNTLGRSKK